MSKKYVLTKLSIKDGHDSNVNSGRTVTGRLKVIRQVTPEEIKEDDEVFVQNNWDYVKTSPIQAIETEFSTKLITRTSTYSLEEEVDSDDTE